jgi:formyl-CoA transferase
VQADKVLGNASHGSHDKFATNPQRNANRAETDAVVAAVFARHDVEPLMELLAASDIAFARVNDSALLSTHPHLRRITVNTPTGPASMPAPAALRAGQRRSYGAIPSLGEHTEAVKAEFTTR